MNDVREGGRVRGAAWLIALALLYPAYAGVRAIVRAHVDRRIEDNLGHAIPEFTLRDAEGRAFTRDSLLGRASVLHFFRSHCVNCEAEMPEVKAFVASLDEAEVAFVSVMTDPVEGYPEETTRRTLERHGLTWPVLMANEAFLDAFHGRGWSHVTPIAYFANQDGIIVETLRGPQTRESLARALKKALGG